MLSWDSKTDFPQLRQTENLMVENTLSTLKLPHLQKPQSQRVLGGRSGSDTGHREPVQSWVMPRLSWSRQGSWAMRLCPMRCLMTLVRMTCLPLHRLRRSPRETGTGAGATAIAREMLRDGEPSIPRQRTVALQNGLIQASP